jgi:hypothetical protein
VFFALVEILEEDAITADLFFSLITLLWFFLSPKSNFNMSVTTVDTASISMSTSSDTFSIAALDAVPFDSFALNVSSPKATKAGALPSSSFAFLILPTTSTDLPSSSSTTMKFDPPSTPSIPAPGTISETSTDPSCSRPPKLKHLELEPAFLITLTTFSKFKTACLTCCSVNPELRKQAPFK